MALFTIDRTVNFEEKKVKNVIKIIQNSKNIEEIEDKMIAQKIVTLRENTEPHGFFKRRWSTFLKEFGLYDGIKLTEMAQLYVNDELSTKELTLLFLIDRVVSHDKQLMRPTRNIIKSIRRIEKSNWRKFYI